MATYVFTCPDHGSVDTARYIIHIRIFLVSAAIYTPDIITLFTRLDPPAVLSHTLPSPDQVGDHTTCYITPLI
jgi:hypothetical protein